MNEYTIHIDRGATYNCCLTFFNDDDTPIDLTGYVPQLEIRENPNTPLLLACTNFVLLNNKLTFEFSPTDTDLLDVDLAYYNLDVSMLGTNIRLLRGKVVIVQNINK